MISADYFKELADKTHTDDDVVTDIFNGIESNAKEGLYQLYYPSELITTRIKVELIRCGYKVYPHVTIGNLLWGSSATIIDWSNPYAQ